ncbi:MAG: 5-formyltetrahydrofolate cyclo-ligase [Flavobacteriaceae bacterium]|nr:5-formyltetrahydrofolate cyclo-ligase [Flavobacteriaceae bacterium]
MDKKALRKLYTEKRMSLSADDRQILNAAIFEQLKNLPIWEYNFYHVYLPIPTKNEPETNQIISTLFTQGKKVMVSKADFTNFEMRHFYLEPNTQLAPGAYQIPEPVDAIAADAQLTEVIFVPLLAFDLQGYRVGYGKGFYDRFMARCQKNTLKIGISFFDPVDVIKDKQLTDIPLDYCVTPERVYRFFAD